MRRLFAGSLSLWAAVMFGTAQAEDIQWRPAAPPATLSAPATDSPVSTVPRVSIGRAVPLNQDGSASGEGFRLVDRNIQTASFQGGSSNDPAGVQIRAKIDDGTTALAGAPLDKSIVAPVPVERGDFTAPPYQGVASQFGADCCGDCCATQCPCSSAFGCCDTGGCCGNGCSRPSCFWLSAEYLLWGIKDSRYPPLVTASPAAVANAGIITTPGTTVLLGGNNAFDNNLLSGGRFNIGVWLDSCQSCGLEAGFFWLGRRTNNFFDSSPGLPVIARPFLDVTTGNPFENAELVASPGVLAGSIRVATTSSLWGGDLDFRKHLFDGGECGYCYKADLLAGFRYIELQEGVSITEDLAIQSGANVPRLLIATGPASIVVNDQFKTTNQFYGGQVGIDGEVSRGRWFVDLNTKLGIGTMHETVNVSGFTIINVPAIGVTTTAPGGLLTQATNIGTQARDRFAFVPEVGLKAGYNITDHLRLFVGYNFLYMSSVVRPGDQIDRAVNTSQLPTIIGPGTLSGSAHPALNIKGTDFWAQGVSFGAELRY